MVKAWSSGLLPWPWVSAYSGLEIGCGVGITACYLAREVGCSLTSVDLSEQMIAWARKRAQREGLTDRVTFCVANAQDLPFAEAIYDAVISRSVTAFAADKPAAVASTCGSSSRVDGSG